MIRSILEGMSPASEENQSPLFLQRMGGKVDPRGRREGMEGGRKGRQTREARGVEKERREKGKRERWNEKGSQERGGSKKSKRKIKF